MKVPCGCGCFLEVPEDRAGQWAVCPACHGSVMVPAARKATESIFPARLWEVPPRLQASGRASSAVIGIILFCLFFLPVGVWPDKSLAFPWQVAKGVAGSMWCPILATFALGVLALLAGIFAAGPLLGVILASGVVGTFLFIVLGAHHPEMGAGGVLVFAIVYLVLTFFLANLTLRRMFPESKVIRIALAATAGLAFLACLLPIEGQIALQQAVKDISSPEAGLILLGGVVASFLALLTLAPLSTDAASSLITASKVFLYLGICYVPVRQIIEVLGSKLPDGLAPNLVITMVHGYVRFLALLLLGANAAVQLFGLIPGRAEMRAAHPNVPRRPPIRNLVAALGVTIAVLGAMLVSLVVTDLACKGGGAGARPAVSPRESYGPLDVPPRRGEPFP